MKGTQRLEQLYKQSLKPPEESSKQLPLAHILTKPVAYYPQEPADWQFDIVEIGPGTGDFLFHQASQHPTHRILGIELGNKRFGKISDRLILRNITNVTLMHADARIALYKYIPDNSIKKCFLLFPDPWPKNSHAHRRLLQQDICRQLGRALTPGGEFILATDVQDYATWARGNLLKVDCLKDTSPATALTVEPEGLMTTYFKQKWIAWGRSFWYVRFEKK